jgi:hypothetical protein
MVVGGELVFRTAAACISSVYEVHMNNLSIIICAVYVLFVRSERQQLVSANTSALAQQKIQFQRPQQQCNAENNNINFDTLTHTHKLNIISQRFTFPSSLHLPHV